VLATVRTPQPEKDDVPISVATTTGKCDDCSFLCFSAKIDFLASKSLFDPFKLYSLNRKIRFGLGRWETLSIEPALLL
jgi:hypothetical protein